MGITVVVDRVACNTSGGNQAITVSAGGLTPKAALFILVAATVDGTAAVDSIISYGAATGTSNRWVVGGFSEDNLGTTATQGWYDNVECIQGYDGATTLLFEADFVSFGVDTVTINWATAPASAWLLTVVSFSGSDLSAHANIKDITNTVDAEIDVTDPGFEPDVLFTASDMNVFNPGQAAHQQLSFGLVHNDGVGGITQRTLAWTEQDARTTSVVVSRNEDSGGILEMDGLSSGNLDFYALFSNFDSSGFSMTAKVAGGNSREIGYLALSFGGSVSGWVGTYSTPTSEGSDSSTAPGFKPQFLFFLENYMPVIDIGYINPNAGSRGFSAMDATRQFSNSFNAEDEATTSNTQSLSDNVAVELPDDDGAAGLTATLTTFDTNGFTLNFSAVEGAAKLFFALAIEQEGGGNTVGRMYVVSAAVAGVTAAIDLIRISAPADAVVVVHKVIISQETEFGDAASEQMDIQFHRGSTDGSGGATPTARPLEVGDAAFGGTVATGNTSQSTEGTFLHHEAANVMAGFVWAATPEERIVLSPSGRLIVELPTAPDDSIDFRVTAYFEEIGG